MSRARVGVGAGRVGVDAGRRAGERRVAPAGTGARGALRLPKARRGGLAPGNGEGKG